MAKFNDGDKIFKVGGRYGGPCRVVGAPIIMDDNYILYTCAMAVEGGYGEFVHVFPESTLSTTPDERQIAADDFSDFLGMINMEPIGLELTPDPNFMGEGYEDIAGPSEVKPPKEETVEFPGYLMTRLLGSGWAAVHMVKVTVRKPGEEPYTYEDVQQTGVGRYATIREAWVEAKMWSESDEIPFNEDEPAKTPVATIKKDIPL